MKLTYCMLVIATFVALKQLPGNAQTSPSATGGTHNDSPVAQADVSPWQVYNLAFSDKKIVAGVDGSRMIGAQPLCSSEGVLFLETPIPPNYRDRRVVSLEEHGGHSFNPGSAPNLYDSRMLSFFPGDTSVAILVRATSDSSESDVSMKSPAGVATTKHVKAGEHRNFILQFDREGNYKSTVDLPSTYEFKRFAELPSGEFLALGYDPVNIVPTLQVINSDGQSVRRIEVPGYMLEEPTQKQAQNGGDLERMKASTDISFWRFVSSMKKVLLYRPNSDEPVLEVSSGGATREVHIETPVGFELDGLVPSADTWIARFRRKGLADSDLAKPSSEGDDYLLFKLNPADGSLVAKLNYTGTSIFGIACEAAGLVSSFSVDADAKFQLSFASIPK
jgi:hypothetical protein